MSGIFDLSTTAGSNSAIAGINIAEGCLASGINNAIRELCAEVKAALLSVPATGTDTITFTVTPAPTAYVDGMVFFVRAAGANTLTNPTANANSLGAITITKFGGGALVAGDIAGANHEVILRYNAGTSKLELLNPVNPNNLTLSTLPTKATPTTADSIVIMDAAASNAAKTATLPKVVAALFSPITASLGGDVALNSNGATFDGPSIAQGSTGTWFVTGTIMVIDSGTCNHAFKLWDGTTVIASTDASFSNSGSSISLSGYISSPAGNIKISVKSGSATGTIKFNQSTFSKDSTISAIRIA